MNSSVVAKQSCSHPGLSGTGDQEELKCILNTESFLNQTLVEFTDYDLFAKQSL